MTSSPLASPSATLAVLKRHGLYTKKRLGQHFLVDDNVVTRIIELAAIDATDTVLEIGPGIGTLTIALCDVAEAVVAIERDEELAPVLAETTAHCPRFAVVRADAVDVGLDEISAPFGEPTALVANLPYGVAATVVLRYFEMIGGMRQATVMVQSEVADRMAARPGTKDYGAYTVKLRLRAAPVGRFPVSAACFLPPPRVDSAVIRLERVQPLAEPAMLARAARVADAAFAQRRKTIRNSLRATLGESSDAIEAAFDATGIDGSVRAETLEPEAFVALANSLPAI